MTAPTTPPPPVPDPLDKYRSQGSQPTTAPPQIQYPYAFDGQGVGWFPPSYQGPGEWVNPGMQPPNPGYWQPQQVGYYYDMIRSSPPEWQAPEWLDTNGIKNAYDALNQRNGNAHWSEWSNTLSPNDTINYTLAGIRQPPPEITGAATVPYISPAQQSPFLSGDAWAEMPDWQKLYSTILDPQPGISGRPKSSRVTAMLTQSLLAAIPGAIAGSSLGPAGTVLGGLALGGANFYQQYTGQEIPLISDVLNLFSLGSKTVEGAFGLGREVLGGQQDDLSTVVDNIGAAWKAGQLNHYTMPTGLANLMSKAFGGEQAGPGEVWKFNQGIVHPVKLAADEVGALALDKLREDYANAWGDQEKMDAITAEFTQRYGVTGTTGEMVWGTVLDPMILMPGLENRLGGKLSDLVGMEGMKTAVEAGRGSFLVDAMPPGLDALVSKLTGKSRNAGLLELVREFKKMAMVGDEANLKFDSLTWLERQMAGLDKEGKDKSLAPNTKTGVAGAVASLGQKTPVAKATDFLRYLEDNLKRVMAEAGGDVHKYDATIRKVTGQDVDPKVIGKGGAAIADSPEMRTIADGLKVFFKGEAPDKLLDVWDRTNEQRARLLDYAQQTGLEPAKVLDMVKDNPQQFMDLLMNKLQDGDPLKQKIINGEVTTDLIKRTLEPFTGENPVSWHPNEFMATYNNALIDATRTHLRDLYGIKAEPAVMRLTSTMKAAQSLLLLGLNPAFLINNEINNIASRAATGVFGYMSDRQIGDWWTRMGFEPYSLKHIEQGTTMGGRTAGRELDQFKRSNDIISKTGDTIRAVSNKVGIFSTLSGMFEELESKQALTIGAQQAWSNLWKRGKGFRKMSPELEARLERANPGLRDSIYAAVEGGMNLKEIEGILIKDLDGQSVASLINGAAEKIMPNDPNGAAELLRSTGIDTEMERLLANAKSPVQIQDAFNQIQKRLNNFVDSMTRNELAVLAEAVQTRVKTEGWSAALDIFSSLEEKLGMEHVQHFVDWNKVFEDTDGLPYDQARSIIAQHMEDSNLAWDRLNKWEVQTYAGIIKGLGIKSDQAKSFISQMIENHDDWGSFYRRRNDRYTTHANTKFDTAEARMTAREKMFAENRADYNQIYEGTKVRQASMDKTFADLFAANSGRPEDLSAVLAWRQNLATMRDEMRGSLDMFMEQLKNTPDRSQRAAMQTKFYQNYSKKWLEFHQQEAQGARELAKLQQGNPTQRRATQPTAPQGKTAGDMHSPSLEKWMKENGYDNVAHLKEGVEHYMKRKYDDWKSIPWTDVELATQRRDRAHNPSDVRFDHAIDDLLGQAADDLDAAKSAAANHAATITGKKGTKPSVSKPGPAAPNAGMTVDTLVQKLNDLKSQVKLDVPADGDFAKQPPEVQASINAALDAATADPNASELLKIPADASNPKFVDHAYASALSEAANARGYDTGLVPRQDGAGGFVTELSARKSKGALSKTQTKAVEALITAHASYMRMTPDEYVNHRFGAIEQGNTAGVHLSFDADGRALLKAAGQTHISEWAGAMVDIFLKDMRPDDAEVLLNYVNAGQGVPAAAAGMTIADLTPVQLKQIKDHFTTYLAKGNAPTVALRPVFSRMKTWMKTIYKFIRDEVPQSDEVSAVWDKVLGQNADLLEDNTNAFTVIPPGTTPQPLYHGQLLNEVINEKLNPLLDQIKQDAMDGLGRKWNATGLDEGLTRELNGYMNQVKSDMGGTKLTALRLGELKKNMSMLNYSDRYGSDNVIDMAFPYQFWYTRSMQEWAMKALDQPKLFTWYARYKQAQKDMEQNGIPSRFRGKMRLNTPWLPEWMGTGVFFDPMSKLFPPAAILGGLDNWARGTSGTSRTVEQTINDALKRGDITQEQATEAIQTQSGQAWDNAYAEAMANSDTMSNTGADLMTSMLSPAMWIDLPNKIAQGKGDQINPLPVTRAASSFETALKGTPLELLGNTVGLAAKPEQYIRKQAGVSEFGQWGDWYVDRELSNMTADGTVDLNSANQAMTERSGEVYDLAVERVRQEQALHSAGTLPIMAMKALLKGKADIGDVGLAVLVGLNNGDLFPKGEMIQRGLLDDYNNAKAAFKAGDTQAYNNFFVEHPEYEARLALYDDPETRMRNILVDRVWNAYDEMEQKNKPLVADQLGDTFKMAFLNSDTADYSSIPVKTLVQWAQQLGASVPNNEFSKDVPSGAALDILDPQVANTYQSYLDDRNRLFGQYITSKQTLYFSYPEKSAARRATLVKYPELKQYWDWNNQYKAAHPEIKGYLEWKYPETTQADGYVPSGVDAAPKPYDPQQMQFADNGKNFTPEQVAQLNPALQRRLFAYAYNNQPLGDGATKELKSLYKQWHRTEPWTEFMSNIRFLFKG